jgi:tRNA (cmo5U34)-methyltransferase
MMRSAEVPAEEVEKVRQADDRPQESHQLAGGGFDSPVLFFQSLLAHAWYARRTALDLPSV